MKTALQMNRQTIQKNQGKSCRNRGERQRRKQKAALPSRNLNQNHQVPLKIVMIERDGEKRNEKSMARTPLRVNLETNARRERKRRDEIAAGKKNVGESQKVDVIVTKALIENVVDMIIEGERKRSFVVEVEVEVIAKVVMIIVRTEEGNGEREGIKRGMRVVKEGYREIGIEIEREIRVRNQANLIKRKVVIAQRIVLRIRTQKRREVTKRVRDIRDAGLDQYQGKNSCALEIGTCDLI